MELPQFRVLGPVEVAGGHGPIDLGGPRQRTVLAVLLAFPNQVVSTDRLVDELWGEKPPGQAKHSLQTYISNLRRLLRQHSLGSERIETRSPGYVIHVDPDEVDAMRFERLFAEARSAEDQAAMPLLEAALGLWSGGAYAEFSDRDTLQIEAIRLEELRFLAKEHRFDCLLRLGRLDEAVAELEAFVASEPLRERPRALLMEALHRVGRQPDALRVYGDYRKLLAEELGLEPSKQLQKLELAILQDEIEGPLPTSPPAPVLDMPEIRMGTFERAPGEQVAYGLFGDGPVIVKPPGWMSNLDILAAGLDYARSALFARLAQDFRVVTYDRYGIGLSQGPISDFSFEASVAELVSFLEALDLGDITLFGESAAGPIVIGAAAAVPDRVSRLVFLGSCASARKLYGKEVREPFLALVRASWGLGSAMLSSLLFPGADAQVHDAFVRLQRKSSNGQIAAGYLEQLYEAEVSHLLPDIGVPVLVLHYRDDRAVPYEGAKQLALGFPDARLVPLDGTAHFPPPQDVERLAAMITRFCMPQVTFPSDV